MPANPESQPRTVVLDVNETLLDVNALRPHFERIFKNIGVLKEWFTHMLLYSQAVTTTGDYVDFTTLARHTMEMMARIHRVPLKETDIASVLNAIKTLPAHPDVSGALQRLHQNGFRLVTLTNSTQSAVESQMHAAGLSPLFERMFSVDSVKKYKPHPETYNYVAKQLNANPSELTMVAAHPWDLMGAKAAGYEVAFVERPGTSWFHISPKPEISGPTLADIATQLISRLEGGR
jgi:2-haloacid dehalogenase